MKRKKPKLSEDEADLAKGEKIMARVLAGKEKLYSWEEIKRKLRQNRKT